MLTRRRVLQFLVSTFVFLLPLQTQLKYREVFLLSAKWEFGTLGFFAVEVILFGAVALFFVEVLAKFKSQERSSWVFTPDRKLAFACLLSLLYVLLGYLFVFDRALLGQHVRWLVMALFIFFIIVSGMVDSARTARWLVFGGIIQALVAIVQFVFQSAPHIPFLGVAAHPASAGGTAVVVANGERWLRSYGMLPHPNMLSGFLVLSIIVSTLLIIGRRKEKIVFEYLIYLAPIICSAGLFFTFSRSGFLAAIIWMTGIFAYYFKKNISVTVAVGGALGLFGCLILIFFPLAAGRVKTVAPEEVRSIASRLQGTVMAEEQIKKNFFVGTGLGNYTASLIKMRPGLPGWAYEPAPNVFLLIMAEWGFFGTLFVIYLFVNYFKIIILQIGKAGYWVYFFILSILPPLLFDHYFVSSYSTFISLVLVFGLIPSLIHRFMKDDVYTAK